MDNILHSLGPNQIAVDLGCGQGSFRYASYPCRIIGVDMALNHPALFRDGRRVQYIQSSAVQIPLGDASVDAVICNHVFEHLAYLQALSEIHRILKPTGLLWVAVPNGYGLDDALYRCVFEGGGHVNRFRFRQLVDEVQTRTDLRLIQFNQLFSGFIYLKRPTPQQRVHFPRRAQFLYKCPPSWNRAAILVLSTTTRTVDRLLGSRTSQYGWGFVFARGEVSLDPLPSFFNVCRQCGSGNDAVHLKASGRVSPLLGIPFYRCSNCDAKNIFFKPLKGLS